MFQIDVAKAEGVKCPRCWKWTGEGRFNFDGLCDECCEVILADFPYHESVPFILASREEQRALFTVERIP